MRPLSPASRPAVASLIFVSLVTGVVALGFLSTLVGRGQRAYACDIGNPDCSPTIAASVSITSPGHGGTDDGSDESCFRDGVEIPCHSASGAWYAPYQCYIQPVPRDQWPAAGDPIYGGVDPDQGSVYWCTQDWTGMNRMVFFKGDPPVDPTVLVYRVIDTMQLAPIRMGTAPRSATGSMGLVGLPTWMWADQPQPNTVGPLSDDATQGPVSVAVTAKVTTIDWDMGDGHSVTCDGPGTPYQPSFGDATSPDCGYLYARTSADQPGDVYTVTATSDWEVTWTANTGAAGVIRVTRRATTDLQVGEMQVVVQ